MKKSKSKILEKERVIRDLNYVAMTRAMEEMYVFFVV
jgi:DNA helicase IV